MYNRAALSGHARAQSRLGFAYQKGKFNQTIDDVEALKWYRQAAEAGDDDAQTRLGWAYNEGDLGLLPDVEEALK